MNMKKQFRQFFCFEGIDGSGKDTQLTILADSLRSEGHTVDVFNYPDYNGPLGECIKSALQDSNFNPYALQLLFSAERLRQLPTLEQSLTANRLVLTNRYRWSSYVYAVARGLPKDWANNLETPLPDPNATFLFDVDIETSIYRTGGSDIIESNRQWLERCREEYLNLAHNSDEWIIIDSHGSPAEIAKTVHSQFMSLFERSPKQNMY